MPIITNLEMDSQFYHTVKIDINNEPSMDIGPILMQKIPDLLQKFSSGIPLNKWSAATIVNNRILLPAGTNLRWIEISYWEHHSSDFCSPGGAFPAGYGNSDETPDVLTPGTKGYAAGLELVGRTIDTCEDRTLYSLYWDRFELLRFHVDLSEELIRNGASEFCRQYCQKKISGFDQIFTHILERTIN